jgi:hypothetical protein
MLEFIFGVKIAGTFEGWYDLLHAASPWLWGILTYKMV